MKNILASICFSIICISAWAGPGDTVVVRTHDNILITTDPSVGNTLYPQWSVFPGQSTDFHKILLRLRMGCRQGAGMHCGEWDYLNHIWLKRKGGVNDTTLLNYEIARFITPYGWSFAQSWKGEWILDVTEWDSFLRDSVEIVYNHSGYESNSDRGWTVTLDFLMIEGTPVHEFQAFHPVWNGWFPYGVSANPIENYLRPDTITTQAATTSGILWVNQTGHGMDTPDNCAEFCPKTRTLKLDGTTFDSRLVWRESCGENPVFPQAGTWVYDRASWCPGSTTDPDKYTLNLSGGVPHIFDMDMQAYTSSGSNGTYVTQTYLFEYGNPTFTLDASMVDVVSPNTRFEFNRLNPICDDPVIIIKNTGSTPLTSLTIEYGVQGGPVATYNWTGNLSFLQTATVTLTTPVEWVSGNGNFEVELKNPNGGVDQYALNNKMVTPYLQPFISQNDVIVFFKTNNFPNETSWYLKDADGNVIGSRTTGLAPLTIYRDTFNLADGCYLFEVIDNDGDGLSFWANSDGAGSISLRKPSTGSSIKGFSGDFGGGINFYFTTGGGLGTEETAVEEQPVIDIYPNPSSGEMWISSDQPINKGKIEVFDLTGKIIFSTFLPENTTTFPLHMAGIATGMYAVKLSSGNMIINKRIVIH